MTVYRSGQRQASGSVFSLPAGATTIWKQWKKPRTKYRNLVRLGIPEIYALMAANSRKGYWRTTQTITVNRAMSKQRLINSDYYDLAVAYQSMHVNY